MLIFGIMIAGIALVTLYGYPLLLQQQVGADEKIMEKNMIVLQNDMKSLAYKTVPFKETSLKIGGGSLTVYNSSDDDSTFTIKDPVGNLYADPFHPGELRYESVSAQTDISLQNGAVTMRPRIAQGSTMLADPRWFYDGRTQTMVINLINITSTGIMAKEGIGTVQMTLGDTNYTYISPVNGGTVHVECDFPNPDQDYSVAWDNYFTTTLGMDQETPGTLGNYIMPDVNTLVIKKYEVQIKNI
jgi:hypothetical protein